MNTKTRSFDAIVLGASSGGMQIIRSILESLPSGFSIPIVIVQHVAPSANDGMWAKLLNDRCRISVKEADEKEHPQPGTVYLAPPNYHLLIEKDRSFTLTIDEKVNFARPSIDVLFETAADAYGDKLAGIILTGGNFDGARGLAYIKRQGGLTIVQDPETAETPAMPRAAVEMASPDLVLTPDEIPGILLKIHLNEYTHYASQD